MSFFGLSGHGKDSTDIISSAMGCGMICKQHAHEGKLWHTGGQWMDEFQSCLKGIKTDFYEGMEVTENG